VPEKEHAKPFINAANKTAYYFAEGMTTEEAFEALFDIRCHSEANETHVLENGDIYRVVRVSARRLEDS